MKIPFNIPCALGTEGDFIKEALANGHISSNGPFTQKCKAEFESKFGFENVLLTPSCTAALEMAAILCDLKAGDEVIMPSFTHVGTANAFYRTGATIRFADSLPHHPNIDPVSVESLINDRTKVIVPVHYGGVPCDMEALRDIAERFNLLIVEDAAQALGSKVGKYGSLACFSFHETKNITCGMGGMLVVNDIRMKERAQHIWENGTDRAEFESGDVPHYSWVDVGSSYGMSDLNAAYLYAQLLEWDRIAKHRRDLWEKYHELLSGSDDFVTPAIRSDHNHHIFYLKFDSKDARDAMMKRLHDAGILAVFHYIPLHSSPFYSGEDALPNCDMWSNGILRLPLYHSMSLEDVEFVCGAVLNLVKATSN